MKLLSQIIALYLHEVNSMHVMATIGCAIRLPEVLINKISESRKRLKMKMEKRKLENNMWAID